jgi:hypothetical protein
MRVITAIKTARRISEITISPAGTLSLSSLNGITKGAVNGIIVTIFEKVSPPEAMFAKYER